MVRTPDDEFGEYLMCENFGQRGLRPRFGRTPLLVVWPPLRHRRRVLRTIWVYLAASNYDFLNLKPPDTRIDVSETT